LDEIPKPQMLDPDRMLINTRGNMGGEEQETRAQILEQGLHQSCGYAEQLWETLDGIRHFLVEMLPPDPRTPNPRATASASPTGPDDEQGWQRWIQAYAAVNSVMTGPNGDSGYGLKEARRQAQLRREAPVLTLPLVENGTGAPAAARTSRADAVKLALIGGAGVLVGTLLRRSPRT
jgi:hypothetical protein